MDSAGREKLHKELNQINQIFDKMSFKMPFGKYKGRDIETLPSSYLRWLAENMDEKEPRNRRVCLAADREYQWREKMGQHFEEDPETQQAKFIKCSKFRHVML